MRLVDKLTAQSDIPDPAGQKDGEAAGPSFYHYVYETVIRESDDAAYLETILFDSATEKRVWMVRLVSKRCCKIKVGDLEAMKSVINSLIDRLASDKMIK